ncbi:MAG: DedA family protein/thiosulfate sulfurtransferase GlpE, partial [Terriglobales bacterium]
QYGLPFVFLNVFLEQLGLPIPAFPTLLVTGALVAVGAISGPALLAVAVTGALVADFAWYLLGRRHGHRVLSTLCRISLSPVSCVRQTESLFERWGTRSLVAAKFIPGFSTVAPPVAGATGVPPGAFLFFDGLGAVVWAGVGIGLGMIFHDAIDSVIILLTRLGSWALVVLGGALALFMFFKWRERKRFYNELRLARIPVADLRRLMDDGHQPVVVDVRSLVARQSDPRSIPGAIALDMAEVERQVPDLPRDREIVLYCSCPSEASAARVARMLMDHGYTRVRPLEGGLEAWVEAGFEAGGQPLVAIQPAAG